MFSKLNSRLALIFIFSIITVFAPFPALAQSNSEASEFIGRGFISRFIQALSQRAQGARDTQNSSDTEPSTQSSSTSSSGDSAGPNFGGVVGDEVSSDGSTDSQNSETGANETPPAVVSVHGGEATEGMTVYHRVSGITAIVALDSNGNPYADTGVEGDDVDLANYTIVPTDRAQAAIDAREPNGIDADGNPSVVDVPVAQPSQSSSNSVPNQVSLLVIP